MGKFPGVSWESDRGRVGEEGKECGPAAERGPGEAVGE